MKKQEIVSLLKLEGDKINELYKYAYDVRLKHVGKKVYLRGIIEFSNICVKNCYYCGIRRDNASLERFTMTPDDIVETAVWAHENGYASMVLQSGERKDEEFVATMERVLSAIADKTQGKMAVTISLGEQSRKTYKRWLDAGARRYLLRIETSNPDLYESLHPADHSFAERLQCLHVLRDLGYQLGTGVMIGLPGQTVEHLADDVLFFEKMDIDMIGMGPYIAHPATPLADKPAPLSPEASLDLALKMIAVTRIELVDVNIAATTALQTLNPIGREMGLMAGANVVMPNITDTKYRSLYKLYEGKPCLDENAEMCRHCLEKRILSIGEEIAYGDPGDPLHFARRMLRRRNL
jgi:biotin synthase